MVVESYSQSQPWLISLPEEPPRDRILEATKAGETMGMSWVHNGKSWAAQGPVPWQHSWPEIVSRCLSYGWELRSLPARAAAA